jgi:hypothetical protein
VTKESKIFSDAALEVSVEGRPVSVTHPSGAILKASPIAPRDIIDGLPEELLRWLHEDVDREGLGPTPRRASQLDFEAIVVDRLFPLRDTRTFIRRLRSHCQATALAAEVLAEMNRQPTKVACICGWLHDIGLAACIKHVDEASYVPDDGALAKLWPAIVRSAPQHGTSLASRWRLPSTIRHAIRGHEYFATLPIPNPIVATTFVAEHVAALVGCDFHEPAPVQAVEQALSMLRLGERDMLVVADRTEKRVRHFDLMGQTERFSEGA